MPRTAREINDAQLERLLLDTDSRSLPDLPAFGCGHPKTEINVYTYPNGYTACRTCRRENARRDMRAQREAKRALIQAARERPCVDCGIDWLPASVMHLDHVRGAKVRTVGNGTGFSIRTLATEIAKCETRCPNCHATRHFEEQHAA